MSLRKHIRKIILESFIEENINIKNGEVFLEKPFDGVKKYKIGDNFVYVLFGDIDYYANKESILSIKGKSNTFTLNKQYYIEFLNELKKRFYSISELANSDLLVSIETSSSINDDIVKTIDKPYITNGIKKINKNFKMKDIEVGERNKLTNLFYKDFIHDNVSSICVIDDFLTTGSSFKNSFELIPNDVKKIGVCLFTLKS